MAHRTIWQQYCIFQLLTLLLIMICGNGTYAATTQKHYFAHDAVEDKYGVIAPWYNGLNGQIDFRVRVAAETLKRYPWTQKPDAMPEYFVNGLWNIDPNGTITALPSSKWSHGDYGQRVSVVIMSLLNYYRYSGDSFAKSHIIMQIEHMLNYGLTNENHEWPLFPISVPVRGQMYGACDPNGIIQLDIAAQQGTALIYASRLIGRPEWLAMAQHWGELFAEKITPRPGYSPWVRYANPEAIQYIYRYWPDKFAQWNTQTGGVVYILEFLDELIKSGVTGKDNNIVLARDAGRAYLRDVLLPRWTQSDVWGRHFWDGVGDTIPHTLFPTDAVALYIMSNPSYFETWHRDASNIMGLFIVRTSANSDSRTDVYSGAWAFPESMGCCLRSLNYSTLALAPVYAQMGVLAGDDLASEIARRSSILATYDVKENGVSEDNIDGGVIIASTWFKIAHPMALKYCLDMIGWMPELFAPAGECHIVRSSNVVNMVQYDKDCIRYSTSTENSIGRDVVRLAFKPAKVLAGSRMLTEVNSVETEGYTLQKLQNDDYILTLCHKGSDVITISGKDSQYIAEVYDCNLTGLWRHSKQKENGTLSIASCDSSNLTLDFKGDKIKILGDVSPEGGIAEIYIDGIKQFGMIDCWSPFDSQNQTLYSHNGLSDTSHSLRIHVCGKKNGRSQGINVGIRRLLWSSARSGNGFGEGGGPQRVQRYIFGYPERNSYMDPNGKQWSHGLNYIARNVDIVAAWRNDTGTVADHNTPELYTHGLAAGDFTVNLTNADIVGAWRNDTGTVAVHNIPELYTHGLAAGNFTVNLTVGPGTYYCRLKFLETAIPRHFPTQQAVSVAINGKTLVEGMLPGDTAGGFDKPLDIVFNDISPQNGIIAVRVFSPYGSPYGFALLRALEIGQGNGGNSPAPRLYKDLVSDYFP